jgi:hypothetical protein
MTVNQKQPGFQKSERRRVIPAAVDLFHCPPVTSASVVLKPGVAVTVEETKTTTEPERKPPESDTAR